MPPKRKRRVSPSSKGLAPGEKLKRSLLPGNNSSCWGWVGAEVHQASDITPEHLLISCGLSKRNGHPSCHNKFSPIVRQAAESQPVQTREAPSASGELDDDVIIISDDEEPICSSKNCKSNPYCLNHLGQEDWEDEDDALEAFMKAIALEDNPSLGTREPNFPVGLKNLGATCYANASLQESPIFQLQVTFAALQEGIQTCFNPAKLVESLHLRTTEQQDAQEFSKLFMSHLDAEFKKQANPKVKTLVTDQFQGKQIYGTLCNNCEYRSERVSDFLEIEINLKNNAKLEDRIEAVLQTETLSGDNQYLCSQCESLQDATRYTELKELPPVLHFSLLRFVYDLSTMERRKSKYSVSFPTRLDMRPFVGSRSEGCSTASSRDAYIYELRGVLLHKGPSAYHGHYEAQVFDRTNEAWFQFNDEIVTKIKALGETSRSEPIIVDDDSDEKLQPRKYRSNARKRRRVESEEESASSSAVNDLNEKKPPQYISSKDAYMLIYARKPDSASSFCLENGDTDSAIAKPPCDALEVVSALNAAHDEACASYDKKEKIIKARFRERRERVMNIYRNWQANSLDEDTVLVTRQALSLWLSQHKDKETALSITTDEADEKSALKRIVLDDITCVHGAVDPGKALNVRRLNRAAYFDIVKDTGWDFDPHLTVFDVCIECMHGSFRERLYQIEHPRSVARFDRISEVAFDCTGFWISKPWVKDWRLTKPKMHIIYEGDPGPDSGDFASDVRCEHGGLSLSTTSRRRISAEAAELLQDLYPSWNPLPTNSELCPVCDANVHISKESKKEVRKQAEDEKAKLKNMHEESLSDDPELVDNVPYALIPPSFSKAWKKWLNRPTDCPRPERVDNSSFICEHNMLVIDPNVPDELESSAVLVHESDWHILETIYPAGPPILITKRSQEDGLPSIFAHQPLVCTDCRNLRKTQWTSTEIILRISGTGLQKGKNSKKGATYSSSGARQSRRLRQIKELGEKRRFAITKLTTVKDIKIMVQDELEIPTICQRLFYRNKELVDNTVTVESLEILAHDVLDLRRESEVVDLDSDSEGEQRPRDKERGFHGTVLGRSEPLDQTQTSSVPIDSGGEKSCSACTFSNEANALSCTICDTIFI